MKTCKDSIVCEHPVASGVVVDGLSIALWFRQEIVWIFGSLGANLFCQEFVIEIWMSLMADAFSDLVKKGKVNIGKK